MGIHETVKFINTYTCLHILCTYIDTCANIYIYIYIYIY